MNFGLMHGADVPFLTRDAL